MRFASNSGSIRPRTELGERHGRFGERASFHSLYRWSGFAKERDFVEFLAGRYSFLATQ